MYHLCHRHESDGKDTPIRCTFSQIQVWVPGLEEETAGKTRLLSDSDNTEDSLEGRPASTHTDFLRRLLYMWSCGSLFTLSIHV